MKTENEKSAVFVRIALIALTAAFIFGFSACRGEKENAGDINTKSTTTQKAYSYSYTSSSTSTTTRKSTTTRRYTYKKTTRTQKSDPYGAGEYAHPDDFYYDHYDDFFDYEDAEDYWEENS